MAKYELTLLREEIDLLKNFRDDICILAEEIDPEERHNWETLAYGFFLGKGLSMQRADELSWVAARHALNFINGNVIFADEV